MATRTLEPTPVRPAQPRPTTRRRATPRPTFTCANCELKIAGRPTIHVGLAFCCAGCVAGGPCTCSYDDFARISKRAPDDWQVHDCLDITAFDEEAKPAVRR